MNFTATLIGQMLAFGIFVWFVMQFVWPPLMRALDERRNKIADGLAAAERGKQDMASAEKKANEALNEAKQRAAEIVAQSEKRAASLIEEAKAKAEAEADRIKASAHAEIEQETNRAKEALRDQVAALAVAGAEKILRRTVDANAHADLLAQLKQEL